MIFARYVGFFVPLGDAASAPSPSPPSCSLRRQLPRRPPGQPAADRRHHLEGRSPSFCCSAWSARSRRAGRASHVRPRPRRPDFARIRPRASSPACSPSAAGTWSPTPPKRPRPRQRTIPRALLIGILIVTACYIALNAAYLYVLPIDRRDRLDARRRRCRASRGRTARRRRHLRARHPLRRSARSTASSSPDRASTRHGARKACLPLARRDPSALQTPHRAILLQAVWSCVLVATGTYRALFTRVIYTEWIFFALMALGLIACCARRRWLCAGRFPSSVFSSWPLSSSPSSRSPPTRVKAATGLLPRRVRIACLLPTARSHAHH